MPKFLHFQGAREPMISNSPYIFFIFGTWPSKAFCTGVNAFYSGLTVHSGLICDSDFPCFLSFMKPSHSFSCTTHCFLSLVYTYTETEFAGRTVSGNRVGRTQNNVRTANTLQIQYDGSTLFFNFLLPLQCLDKFH